MQIRPASDLTNRTVTLTISPLLLGPALPAMKSAGRMRPQLRCDFPYPVTSASLISGVEL